MADLGGWAARYRGVVCDLDGVVRRGTVAIDYAVEVLTALSIPVVYATNNASLTAEAVADQLTGLGLTVTPAEVVTSSQAGAAFVASEFPPGSTVLAVGGPGVAAALTDSGLHPVKRVEEGVVAVLQGYGPEVTATDLAHAAYAVQSGARWVATNLDATLPTPQGVAPGNGALVAAVALATGSQPMAMGKPQPPLYDLAVVRLGQPAAETLAIGDRLDTDILGAMAAGMDSLWVLTGVDHLVSFARAPGRPTPTYTGTDLRVLAQAPPSVARDGDNAWVCGPVRLTVSWPSGRAHVETVGSDPREGQVTSDDVLPALAVSALIDGRDRRGIDTEALVRVAEHLSRQLPQPLRPH